MVLWAFAWTLLRGCCHGPRLDSIQFLIDAPRTLQVLDLVSAANVGESEQFVFPLGEPPFQQIEAGQGIARLSGEEETLDAGPNLSGSLASDEQRLAPAPFRQAMVQHRQSVLDLRAEVLCRLELHLQFADQAIVIEPLAQGAAGEVVASQIQGGKGMLVPAIA